MPKEKLPIDQTLIAELETAKANADVANQTLTDVQYKIYEAVKDRLPEKGITHFEGLEIVTGFYEKYDQEKLREAKENWNANVAFPFKEELKADGTALKYVKENVPEAYKLILDALTLTEKKPSFKLVKS